MSLMRISTSPDQKKKEKEELSSLNQRLEQYTDHVRNLSQANKELQARLDAALHKPTKGSENIYKEQLKALGKELEDAKAQCSFLERDLEKKAREALEEQGKARDIARLLDLAEKNAIALAQKIPDLERALDFKDRIHNEEKADLAKQIGALLEELENMKKGGKGELLKELEKERKSLKALFDDERQRLLEAHTDLVDKLQSDIANMETENTNLRVEKASLQKKVDALNQKLGLARDEELALQSKLQKIKEQYDSENEKIKAKLAAKEDEISRLRNDISTKSHQLEDLSSANFTLDYEIQAYRRILAREEDRFGLAPNLKAISYPGPFDQKYLPPPPTVPSSSSIEPKAISPPKAETPPPKKLVSRVSSPKLSPPLVTVPGSLKRKAEDSPLSSRKVPKMANSDSSAQIRFRHTKSGIVRIQELDPQGHFIKIANLTTDQLDLSEWYIQVTTGESGTHVSKPSRFKFPSESLLPGDSTLKVLVKFQADFEGEPFAIKEGCRFQLIDREDNLICEVSVEADSEGDFGRFCPIM